MNTCQYQRSKSQEQDQDDFLPVLSAPQDKAEVPGSSFFDSDSGSETVQSRNSVPIPIPRLSMARTRFRVRFRDCTGFELDSNSGSETAQA